MISIELFHTSSMYDNKNIFDYSVMESDIVNYKWVYMNIMLNKMLRKIDEGRGSKAIANLARNQCCPLP